MTSFDEARRAVTESPPDAAVVSITPAHLPWRELQQLCASRGLQESFARLSNYSRDIAHELRTPVSNLMLQTQVAASKPRGADEYRELLYANLEEFERLARMIGDMLFLAQADNGLALTTRSRVDLAEELRALFGFYEALADEHRVRLALDGDGHAEGDAAMIRRALGNLLANAIRHTPRGATLTAALTTRPDGGTRLQMRNPGTIAPEHLPRLFDRFYRVDDSRQPVGTGAGLGLAITHSIVAAHGGTTTIISFAAQHVGMSLKTVVEEYHEAAERGAHVDYAFAIRDWCACAAKSCVSLTLRTASMIMPMRLAWPVAPSHARFVARPASASTLGVCTCGSPARCHA